MSEKPKVVGKDDEEVRAGRRGGEVAAGAAARRDRKARRVTVGSGQWRRAGY